MKIAVIGAKGLPAKQGGIEHHCEEIYSRIVRQGHSVDLFARSSYTGSLTIDKYSIQGVRVISLPCLQVKGMDALLSSALGAIASTGGSYDIIHFHALGPALFTWLPKVATTAKVVVTCHGLDWRRAKWSKISSELIHLGEKAAVRFANRLIVVSEELNSYFRQTYNINTEYITNAPSSLGTSDPNFQYGSSLGLSSGKYIMFMGRLVPEKLPDVLIRAFQTLKPEGYKLVLVGGTSDTGGYTSKLFELAADNPDIVFTNELNGPRLAEILRHAKLFVLPSEVEGLPLALLEAMQEGIPVLASNLPVHRQLLGIGKQRGMLFPVGDVPACVQSLDWALTHPQELALMAKEAQEYIKTHHNWDDIASNTLKVYNQLLEQVPDDHQPVPVPDDHQPVPVPDDKEKLKTRNGFVHPFSKILPWPNRPQQRINKFSLLPFPGTETITGQRK
ncbi:MAG: glycosyltransferase family 4 protein [Symploca sp. SIO2E6]|nr:glycosyltransferase family 4 protein [Symploca sp. SIO2E6]